MIKSGKKAIKAILGDADVTDEELHSAICGAERLLNSRPLTYVSSDPHDLSPLTPSHFLVGELGRSFAPEAFDHEQAYNPKKRWHRVQQLLGQFWKRWRKEFLPSLNARKKWFHPRHNLKEGDVVLIVEPNARRGEWPLGRVIEAYPGADGLVRVVKSRQRTRNTCVLSIARVLWSMLQKVLRAIKKIDCGAEIAHYPKVTFIDVLLPKL